MNNMDRMRLKETEEAAQWFRERLDYDHESGVLTWKDLPIVFGRFSGKPAGSIRVGATGYCVRSIGRRVCGKKVGYQYHRVAWMIYYGCWPDGEIDHIDGDASGNNRIENLRVVSRTENLRNSSISKRNKSGVVGVSWDKRIDRWRSTISVDKKLVHIGEFKEFQDAVNARKAAEVKHGYHENHGRQR